VRPPATGRPSPRAPRGGSTRYNGTAWSRGGDEDRALFIFPIDDARFRHRRLRLGVPPGEHDHGRPDGHATGTPGTGSPPAPRPSQTADDQWLGRRHLQRVAPTTAATTTRASPPTSSPAPPRSPRTCPRPRDGGGGAINGPLWVWEAAPFNPALPWANGDSFPGVYARLPTGSRADVRAVARFDATTGTWTLELSRLRRTGNRDDVAF
jgi:hypothetical protein